MPFMNWNLRRDFLSIQKPKLFLKAEEPNYIRTKVQFFKVSKLIVDDNCNSESNSVLNNQMTHKYQKYLKRITSSFHLLQ